MARPPSADSILRNMKTTPISGGPGLVLGQGQEGLVLPNHSGTHKRVKVEFVDHAYGGFQDAAYTLPVSAATWTHVTNLTNTLFTGLEGVGMDLIADQMIMNNTGHYFGTLSLTFSALADKNYKMRLRNITQSKTMGYVIGISTTGVTNFSNVTLPLYIEANAGDVLQMEMRCGDSTDPKLRSAVFYISYHHE